MTERLEHPRGTLDWLPPRVALRQHVIDVADRDVRTRGLPPDRDTRLRGHGALRPHRGRDFGRRLQGDVLVPRSQRPLAHPAARGHRAGRARLPRARPVARAAARAPLVRRADVPLRRAAGAAAIASTTQFGVEAIGSDDPAVDAEVIALQAAWYRARSGSRRPRAAPELDRRSAPAGRPIARRCVAYFEPLRDQLSPDSQAAAREEPAADPRLQGRARPAARRRSRRGSPTTSARTAASTSRRCARYLTARGVEHVLDDPRSCAGSTTTRARPGSGSRSRTGGAQATISGGGRYDGLAEQIGGKRTPGVGFGCGIERLVLALEKQGRVPEERGCDCVLAVDVARGAPARRARCSTRRAPTGSRPRRISPGAA